LNKEKVIIHVITSKVPGALPHSVLVQFVFSADRCDIMVRVSDQLGLRRCRIKQNVTQESRIGSMLQREYDCS